MPQFDYTHTTLRDKLSLYLVTDDREDTDDMLRAIASAIAGGVTAVQLRRKHDYGRRFVELGHMIREMTRSAGVQFIVNDRVDVAQLVDADGVHVGQDDISYKDARKLFPNGYIGVSATTLEEALAAQADGADYIGVGAIFATQTKNDAKYTGLDGLVRIVNAVSIPVVAIGGIQLDNVDAVLAAGADGIAVVSSVMSAPSPENAAKALQMALSRQKR